MKLIKYYEIHELNGKISNKKILFKPKGKCKFLAELRYSFGDFKISVDMDTDHKVSQKEFALWTQKQLDKYERDFYGKVAALKADDILKGIVRYPTPDTTGSFKAYVVV